MLAIFKRELRSYFTTPLGYVFLGIFLTVTAIIFCFTTVFAMTSEVTGYFSTMLMAMIVILPLLTMKSFTDEKKQRTEQLLLTAPVSLWSVVTAKFLAAYSIFTASTLFSTLYFLVLTLYGRIKVSLLFGNLLAILLLGMAFIAIGVFVSSVTENQLTAAILTMVILIGFYGLSLLCQYIAFYPLRFVLECLSLFYRFQNFGQGVLDFAGLFYYLSITALFLFLTVRVLDRRRYQG